MFAFAFLGQPLLRQRLVGHSCDKHCLLNRLPLHYTPHLVGLVCGRLDSRTVVQDTPGSAAAPPLPPPLIRFFFFFPALLPYQNLMFLPEHVDTNSYLGKYEYNLARLARDVLNYCARRCTECGRLMRASADPLSRPGYPTRNRKHSWRG